MLDSTSDNDDLTPTQEYAIAGGVILLFGLLYWYLNNGWSGDAALNIAQAPISQSVMVGQSKFAAATGMKEVDIGGAENVAVDASKASVAAVATTAAVTAQATLPANANAEVKTAETVPTTVAQTAPAASAAVAPATTAQVASAPVLAPVPNTGTLEAGPVGPASPVVGQAASAPQSTVYSLPDGTKIDIGQGGFGAAFKDAIAKHQTDKPIIFDGIKFDSGASKPNTQSNDQLNVVVALLNANPDIKLLIRGHTDEVGTAKDNTELSLVRANEVGVALVQAGIDRKRLRIMGMGSSEPISIDNTEAARQRNRRIDALILK